jgi:EAL domain-containing protein (putative c-di-GMP-specific phosphodiesterase class I)
LTECGLFQVGAWGALAWLASMAASAFAALALVLLALHKVVETSEQTQFLADLGCDQYRGYLCPPLTACDFANLVIARRLCTPMRAEPTTAGTASATT